MSSNLDLNTVELASTLRTAPLNGSPSSSDFNEGQRETLVDLASLSGFINNTLLPLLNALPAISLLPTQDPVGIEGRTIWTDTSDLGTLFFDSLASSPLTIADTVRVINGIVVTMRQQLIDQGVEVASLQARLASTNQNDIALALQNLTASLNQLTAGQQIHSIQLTEIQGTKIVPVRSSIVSIPAGTTQQVVMVFPTAFIDNFYTVTTGIEVTDGFSGLVNAAGFSKNGVGIGITIGVINNDSVSHNIVVHIQAVHD